MDKILAPPSAKYLAKIKPIIAHIKKGTILWRIYNRMGAYPTQWNEFRHYGPIGHCRFDHHKKSRKIQKRGILYGTLNGDGSTCFAEFFQKARTIGSRGNEPWLTGFQLTKDVKLLDLTNDWPVIAGTSQALSAGGPYEQAHCWSQTIYEAYPMIEGLKYNSAMDNKPVVALYERALKAIPKNSKFNRALADPGMARVLINVAKKYNYKLA